MGACITQDTGCRIGVLFPQEAEVFFLTNIHGLLLGPIQPLIKDRGDFEWGRTAGAWSMLDIPSLKVRPSGLYEKSGTNHAYMLRNISEFLHLHTNPCPFNPVLNCFVRGEILFLKPLRFQ